VDGLFLGDLRSMRRNYLAGARSEVQQRPTPDCLLMSIACNLRRELFHLRHALGAEEELSFAMEIRLQDPSEPDVSANRLPAASD